MVCYYAAVQPPRGIAQVGDGLRLPVKLTPRGSNSPNTVWGGEMDMHGWPFSLSLCTHIDTDLFEISKCVILVLVAA